MVGESGPQGLLGIDIGGSFTDAVSSDPVTGELRYGKTATYPDDLVRSLRESIDEVDASLEDVAVLRHGTTVVINAILTSSGAKTALLTTQGFRDVLEIGRTNWPEPYNLFYDRLPPLVPRELRLRGARAHGQSTGRGRACLSTTDALRCGDRPDRRGSRVSTAVAVCLLHAYVNPEHEQAGGRGRSSRLRSPTCTCRCPTSCRRSSGSTSGLRRW